MTHNRRQLDGEIATTTPSLTFLSGTWYIHFVLGNTNLGFYKECVSNNIVVTTTTETVDGTSVEVTTVTIKDYRKMGQDTTDYVMVEDDYTCT